MCDSDLSSPVQKDRYRKWADLNTLQFKKIINYLGKKGYKKLELAGGEPTVREDLFEIALYAKENGFLEVYTTTNGRMLSYLPYAKKIYRSNFNSLNISILGHNSRMHEAHTRAPGSFLQTVRGIKNLAYLNNKFEVNIIITKKNYKYLLNIAKLISKYSPFRTKLLFIYPFLKALDSPYSIIPQVSLTLPYIEKTVLYLHRKGILVNIENIPPCILHKKILAKIDRMRDSISVLSKSSYYFHRLHHTLNWVSEHRYRLPVCRDCEYINECLGPTKEYVRLFGTKEFGRYLRH